MKVTFQVQVEMQDDLSGAKVSIGCDQYPPPFAAAIRFWAEERIRIGKNRWNDEQIIDAMQAASRMEREYSASKMSTEKQEQTAFEKWFLSMPRCVSYPKCDGELVGMNHKRECPMSKVANSAGYDSMVTLGDSWHAALQAACEAECEDCHDGLVLYKERDGKWWHARFIGDEMRIPCRASRIRALMTRTEGR